MVKETHNYEWIDKSIRLHKKHGLNKVDLSQLRQIDEEDALKAAEYAYNDMIANKEEYSSFNKVLDRLQALEPEDRPKAVGVLFETMEVCGKECTLPEVRRISRKWNVDDDIIDDIVRVIFTEK